MRTVKTQVGIALSADFEEGTLTFQMPKGYSVVCGTFAIVDKSAYDALVSSLKGMIEINGVELTEENADMLSETHNAARAIIESGML